VLLLLEEPEEVSDEDEVLLEADEDLDEVERRTRRRNGASKARMAAVMGAKI